MKSRIRLSFRLLSAFIAAAFSFTSVLPPVYAQGIVTLNLPAPGVMVAPSPGFVPVHISGVTINPDNPLQFDFIINKGDTHLSREELKQESEKLIKYFLASLTVPEEELWVNLSPYEKNRITSAGFGETTMGRDMLAQDYILKQLMASMMYPEKELGRKFWDRVYQKAYEHYGVTDISINTFNKIWIVPDEAVVYQQGLSAFVIKSRLKVMLEEDYLALAKSLDGQDSLNATTRSENAQAVSGISSEIVREILLPEIEKEVNEGETFANLRQIYNSLILAVWYKTNLKESLLGRMYVNQNKTKGIDFEDKQVNEKIYAQYVESFKNGVYNYIREEQDPMTQEMMPRKYFSGGVNPAYSPIKKLWLASIIGIGLLMGSPGKPVSAEVFNVLNDPDQFVAVTRLAEKPEEATVISLEAQKIAEEPILLQSTAKLPSVVVQGTKVDFGDAILNGDVHVDNWSGRPISLRWETKGFFPETNDGRLIISDTHIVILKEGDSLPVSSSPMSMTGKVIREMIITTTITGILLCFSGCGSENKAPTPSNTEVAPVDQITDMSQWSTMQLREAFNNSDPTVRIAAVKELINRGAEGRSELTLQAAIDFVLQDFVRPRLDRLTFPVVENANITDFRDLRGLADIDELKQALNQTYNGYLRDRSKNTNVRKWSAFLFFEIASLDERFAGLSHILENVQDPIYEFAFSSMIDLILEDSSPLEKALGLLNHPVKGVRLAAIKAVGQIGEEAGIAPLENFRNNETDPDILAAVKSSLEMIYSVVDFVSLKSEQLIKALDEPVWIIQRNAAKELFMRGDQEGINVAREKLVWPRIQRLGRFADSRLERSQSYYQELVQLGDIAIDPLKEKLLFQRFTNTDAVKWAALLLGTIGNFDEVFPSLLIPFEKPGYAEWHRIEARNGLFNAMSRLADVDRLTALLLHPIDMVKQFAASFLKDKGDDRSIDNLAFVVANSPDWNTRREAAWAMANIANLESVGPLMARLEVETDYRTRDMIRHALGTIGDPAPVQMFLDKLNVTQEPDFRLRIGIVTNLKRIGDPSALTLLEQTAANDPHSGVRAEAQKSINWIKELETSGVLNLRGNPQSIDQLIAAIANPLASVRYFAVRELGHLRAEKAIAVLEERRDKDTDAEVRSQANTSLKKIFFAADVRLWSNALLTEALNKPYWIIQHKSALELYRRNDASGIALSLEKLFEPRMARLSAIELRTMDESDYQQLISLGGVIEDALIRKIRDFNTGKNTRRWAMHGLGDTARPETGQPFLESIINDTIGTYNPWGQGMARRGLSRLLSRQSTGLGSSPLVVFEGNKINLGNAVFEGEVLVRNLSGRDVDLSKDVNKIFPLTSDGRSFIKDTAVTIVESNEEAKQLANSPIPEKGQRGNTLKKAILAIGLGTLLCFGAGCGGGGGKDTSIVDEDKNPDMSAKTIQELRDLLKSESWPVQRNAALEINKRLERKDPGVTIEDMNLVIRLLVLPRIAALTSPDPVITVNSNEYKQLLELGIIGKESFKKQLENESADINTRRWSEQLLEEILDEDTLKQFEEIIPSLTNILKRPNSVLYNFALEKVADLIYRHPLALDTGINLLKNPVAGIRMAAANALASLGFDKAIVPIGNARNVETDPQVIAALDAAITALSQMADMPSWPLSELKAALNSPYWVIQKIAIQLVLERGDQQDRLLAIIQIEKKINQLTSPDENTRHTTPYIHLLELGHYAVGPLRGNVGNHTANLVTRQWSLDLLIRLQPYEDIFPLVEAILADTTHPLNSFAVNSLKKLILMQLDPLQLGLELLNSGVAGVRLGAIAAIGETGQNEGIGPLKNVMANNAPAEAAAAKNALNVLYGKVDLTTWTRSELITELDNTFSWVIQKRAAQELFRRNDAAGIQLARDKLVWPRLHMLANLTASTNSVFYRELVELGYIIIDPALTLIKENSIHANLASKLLGILLGSMGEFNHVTPVLVEITTEKGYVEWQAGQAQNGLNMVYERQTPEFLVNVLNDNTRSLGLQIKAAQFLGIKKFFPAINHLEKKRTATTNPAFITTLDTALSQMLSAMAEGSYNEVFDRLVSLVLTHPEYSTYHNGIEELKKLILKQPKPLTTAVEFLSHNVVGVRAGAIKAMGEINDPAVFPHLINALSDVQKVIRFYAAEALGKRENPAYLPNLVTLRNGSQDSDVALSAEKAIVRISIANNRLTSLTNQQLVVGLDVDNWPTQKISAQELFARDDKQSIAMIQDRFIWPLINQLNVSNIPPQIEEYGDITLQPLQETAFRRREPNTDAVKWAFPLSAAIGRFEDVFATIIFPLDNPHLYAWWHLAEADGALWKLLLQQSQERLMTLLNHHNVQVRNYAGSILATKADETASDAFMDKVQSDEPVWYVRQQSFWGLANLYETRAVDLFIGTLNTEPDARNLGVIILGLGNFGDPGSVSVLANALKTETDPGVRAQAADALWKIGNLQALPDLQQAAQNDVDPSVQAKAREAIDRLNELEASGILNLRGNPESVDELIDLTQHSLESIRYFAARELGFLRALEAVPVFENIRDNNADAQLRTMAEVGLKKIFFAADVSDWSAAQLREALDKSYWPIQRKAALEFYRRNDAGGVALSLEKLFGPRINRLNTPGLRNIDGQDYLELKSLGEMIGQALRGKIEGASENIHVRRWAMVLYADTQEFNTGYPFLKSIIDDTSGTYHPWAGGMARRALTQLFKRQPVVDVIPYLRNATDAIQIAAAGALGSMGDPAALPTLQSVADDTRENSAVIAAMREAIEKINAAVSSSPLAGQDFSVLESSVKEKRVGGINFNPALLNLQIKRDSSGVPLPLQQQPVADIHIEGLFPVIINIVPVTNLPLLLGLADTQDSSDFGGNFRSAPMGYNDKFFPRDPEEITQLSL